MGLKEMLGGVGLILLFIICLAVFASQFIITNNPEATSNPAVARLNSSIAGFQEKANALQDAGNNAKNLLNSETPSSTFLFLIIYSAFTIPISFLSFLIAGTFSILDLMFVSFFGTGTESSPFYIVFVIMTGLLFIAITLTILKAIRLGQTER